MSMRAELPRPRLERPVGVRDVARMAVEGVVETYREFRHPKMTPDQIRRLYAAAREQPAQMAPALQQQQNQLD